MWLLGLMACGSGEMVDGKQPALAPAKLVVYSGRSESLVGPVFAQLEKDLGIQIEVQYGKTPELVTRMLTEGAESPADVIFAQDSGHLGVLSKKGALAEIPDELVKHVDPRFRTRTWVGTSGRLRTLVIDSQLPESERPKKLEDLSSPRFEGKVGWAPGNGSFQAHVSALRHHWGEEKTKAWLAAVKANGARTYAKNSAQVQAANTGEIVVGWVNHYYLYRLEEQGRRAVNHAFPEEGKAGNILMVAGAGIRRGSPNQAEARALLQALTDEKRQTYFAHETYEYPTRLGATTHPMVPSLGAIPLLDVPQEHLADLGPTRLMLQELGLQ